jgi:hypothetical protein
VADSRERWDAVALVPIGGRGTVPVDEARTRVVEAFRTSLQMLASQQWAYDGATETLFTSEAFSHVWRRTADGPWVVDRLDGDSTTVRGLTDFLASTRFWWLAGAQIAGIKESLDETLSRPISRICPGYGCVLEGRAVVERHIELLYAAIERLSEQPMTGVALMPA